MTGIYSIIAAVSAISGVVLGAAGTFTGVYFTYRSKDKELSISREKNQNDGALALCGRLQEEVRLEREIAAAERARANETSAKVDDLQKKYQLLNDEVMTLKQRSEETAKVESANKRLEIENNNLRRDLGRERELRLTEQEFLKNNLEEMRQLYREAAEMNAQLVNGTHPSQQKPATAGNGK